MAVVQNTVHIQMVLDKIYPSIFQLLAPSFSQRLLTCYMQNIQLLLFQQLFLK